MDIETVEVHSYSGLTPYLPFDVVFMKWYDDMWTETVYHDIRFLLYVN